MTAGMIATVKAKPTTRKGATTTTKRRADRFTRTHRSEELRVLIDIVQVGSTTLALSRREAPHRPLPFRRL